MESSKVVAVCISQAKHTPKKNVEKGVLEDNYGIIGDAHGDSGGHRQVSLLAKESIQKVVDLGLDVDPGDFAENITTEGVDLTSLPLGAKIAIGDESILQVTQIGKECHNTCAIGQQVGDCIMPREGIFARVIKGGKIEIGDEIRLIDSE